MKNNLKLATEFTENTEINSYAIKLLSSFIILLALVVLCLCSASALGCGGGGGGCWPSCGPCQTCQGSACVSTCLSSQCQTCVNGQCQSTCNSGQCQTCVNGQCQSTCNPATETCVNGQCVSLSYIDYTYDEVGNRISMTDPCGTTSYTYDYFNRLISVANPDNKTIAYQYDAGGNRTKLTDPNGNITTYAYDKNSRLTDVNAPTGITTYQYDSLGNQIRVDYPNGTYTQYFYNSQRNWLVSLINKEPNNAVMSYYSYTYDNVGNRLSVTENDGSVVSYSYDNIYQLTCETRTGTNPYAITYQYDSVGNRTQMIKNGITTNYTYNNNNQLLTETTGGTTATFAYDLNGNLLSKTAGGNTTTYTWGWANRLLSVSQADGNTVYEYDGDGTRISKTQNGVQTKYINDVALPLVQVIMETNEANAVQAIYTYGNDLITADFADFRGYYLYDGLGSVRQLTGDSGAVTKSYTYDSFGNVISSVGSVVNSYGFTGEQQFGEADNLVFLRARYYDPRIGRFISRDPLGYVDSKNLYQYCLNNPINYTDPFGLNIWKKIKDWFKDWFKEWDKYSSRDEIRDEIKRIYKGERTPSEGEPGSRTKFVKDDGGETIREYGPDGRAKRDIDSGHDKDKGERHIHKWDWSGPEPRRCP